MTPLIDELCDECDGSHMEGWPDDLLRRAAERLSVLERICKKQENTIQRYEDAFMNGDDDE